MGDNEAHKRHLELLRELAKQYHLDFCVQRTGVPEKPKSERDTCRREIYDAAKIYGVSPSTMDALMDEAEKQYAQYFAAV